VKRPAAPLRKEHGLEQATKSAELKLLLEAFVPWMKAF
jgi:hypothetical protein